MTGMDIQLALLVIGAAGKFSLFLSMDLAEGIFRFRPEG